jgi:hypothetical protein
VRGKKPSRTIGKNNAKDEWRGISAIYCLSFAHDHKIIRRKKRKKISL